jgi:hypothetical protein
MLRGTIDLNRIGAITLESRMPVPLNQPELNASVLSD